jgi:lipopolysaccharide biosynthesis glycosyltransferase
MKYLCEKNSNINTRKGTIFSRKGLICLKHTDRIHVVAVADDRYVQHLGVNFTSLIMHKSQDRSISLHVIDGGISPKNKHLLQLTLEKLGAIIIFHTINTDIYQNMVVSQHITKVSTFHSGAFY